MIQRRTTLLLIPTLLLVVFGALFVSMYRPDLPTGLLNDLYTNDQSRFADVAGMRVHYRLEGDAAGKPTLVLIHGTGSSLHTWDGWVPWLVRDFRILRMDLPGFGLTGPSPDHDYTIDSYVGFIDALTHQLGIDSFHVAGNSLGGRIAWNLALAQPERVERLVLIDAAGYPHDEPVNQSLIFRLARLPGISALLSKLTPRWLVETSLRDVYGDETRLTTELVDRYFDLSRRPGNRDAFTEVVLDAMQSIDGDHRQISQPTLILWGAEDRWIPLEDGRAFAREIPDARLIVYPGVGHVPMEELPGPTARAAASFLAD